MAKLLLFILYIGLTVVNVVGICYTYTSFNKHFHCTELDVFPEVTEEDKKSIQVLEIEDSNITLLPKFAKSTWPNLTNVQLRTVPNLLCSELETLQKRGDIVVDFDNSCKRKFQAKKCQLGYFGILTCTALDTFPNLTSAIRKKVIFLDVINSTLHSLPMFTKVEWPKLEYISFVNVLELSCSEIEKIGRIDLHVDHQLACYDNELENEVEVHIDKACKPEPELKHLVSLLEKDLRNGRDHHTDWTVMSQLIALLVMCGLLLIFKGRPAAQQLIEFVLRRRQRAPACATDNIEL